MPPFPVHTHHSFESPVALDGFKEHSIGWEHYATCNNFSSFRRMLHLGACCIAGIRPVRRYRVTIQLLLRGAVCLQAIPCTLAPSVLILTETSGESNLTPEQNQTPP